MRIRKAAWALVALLGCASFVTLDQAVLTATPYPDAFGLAPGLEAISAQNFLLFLIGVPLSALLGMLLPAWANSQLDASATHQGLKFEIGQVLVSALLIAGVAWTYFTLEGASCRLCLHTSHGANWFWRMATSVSAGLAIAIIIGRVQKWRAHA